MYMQYAYILFVTVKIKFQVFRANYKRHTEAQEVLVEQFTSIHFKIVCREFATGQSLKFQQPRIVISSSIKNKTVFGYFTMDVINPSIPLE